MTNSISQQPSDIHFLSSFCMHRLANYLTSMYHHQATCNHYNQMEYFREIKPSKQAHLYYYHNVENLYTMRSEAALHNVQRAHYVTQLHGLSDQLLISSCVGSDGFFTARKTLFCRRYCFQLRLYIVLFFCVCVSISPQFFTRNIQDTSTKLSGIICRPPQQIKFDYHNSNSLPVALRTG